MSLKALVLFAASTTAHFGLEFPEWRADTLKASEDSGYNQRIYPCTLPLPSFLLSPLKIKDQATNTLSSI
jgi:hypothetical protein